MKTLLLTDAQLAMLTELLDHNVTEAEGYLQDQDFKDKPEFLKSLELPKEVLGQMKALAEDKTSHRAYNSHVASAVSWLKVSDTLTDGSKVFDVVGLVDDEDTAIDIIRFHCASEVACDFLLNVLKDYNTVSEM